MRQVIIIGLFFFLTSCASQTDDFYNFYEPKWKPKKVVAVEAPAGETKVEEVVEKEPEQRPTIIVRAHKLNPVYQGIKFLDYTEKEDRRELKELTGVDPVRIEWCAAFVNAILEKSEIPSNKNHKYPLVARSFLDWGVSVKEPAMGDLVIFPRGTEGWQGHVGFYVKSQEIEGILYYYILGGNQRNKVSVELYRADKALGIRRYEESKPSVNNITAE